jgi:hypothetical protein
VTYHQRIRDIQRNLVMGHQDKQTCLAMFDELLHEYGLLPKEEGIDRSITDDNFLGLLKLALNYRDPKSSRDPLVSREASNYLESLKRINDMLDGGSNLAELPRDPTTGLPIAADIAGIIKRRCPVCEEQADGLFNRVQTADSQVLPVDPPRCKECMMKWVEKEVGHSLRPKDSQAEPTVSRDDSAATPLKADEADFFAAFEDQMRDFKP